jgi:hypothetical protein
MIDEYLNDSVSGLKEEIARLTPEIDNLKQ